MPLEWRSDYDLDCPDLDRDHRDMFAVLTELESAVTAGKAGRCTALVTSLIGFCKRHFSTEEAMMARYGYPDRAAHAAHHRHLLNQAWGLVSAARHAAETGDTALCVRQAQAFLDNDILDHDRAFADFVRERGLECSRADAAE